MITDQSANPLAEKAEAFHDHGDALLLLRAHFSDPATLSALRLWAHENGFFKPVGTNVLDVLATLIHARRLNLMRIKPQSHYAADAEPKPDKPDTPVIPKPKPKPKKEEKIAELVVIVKDEDGNPIEGAKVAADGAGSMETNVDGIADFGEVEPGKYDVEAEKEGHARKRKRKVGPDKDKNVSVPDGTKTTVNLIQHPICASVAFFEGPVARTPATRQKYFGFDHKTDMAKRKRKQYWTPCPDHGDLSLPGDKLTRDGARWVSIAVGKEVELEINFDFKRRECIPCISNSTFEVVPSSVAEVVTPKISAKKAVFKIKGKAKGEASLKVICDGEDIGWFHIWCQEEVTLKLDVAGLVTTRAPSTSYSMSALQAHFDDIYRQALIKVGMLDLGDIDLTANTVLPTIEAHGYSSAGVFLSKSGSPPPYDSKSTILTALSLRAHMSLAARTAEPLARAGAYRLYWYVPPGGCSILGTVPNIGSNTAFVFEPDSATAQNTAAHEFGHCLNLRHPSDPDATGQYAGHILSSRNSNSPAYDETNTEPSSAKRGKSSNVCADDPTNLMGYWWDFPNCKPLRYHQWKAASRS